MMMPGPAARGGTVSRPTGWPVRAPPGGCSRVAWCRGRADVAAIPHQPSTAERTADLRGMVHDLNVDIESCAGGVNDSITALRPSSPAAAMTSRPR